MTAAISMSGRVIGHLQVLDQARGAGTEDMVKRAEAAGVPVMRA